MVAIWILITLKFCTSNSGLVFSVFFQSSLILASLLPNPYQNSLAGSEIDVVVFQGQMPGSGCVGGEEIK